ncbi:heavy-metal-associated domain-containing protein [Paracnuella aquatica]|uniref:heavy-metal-associated domain-containing protein n=1 Tax=Paracnuella aquatica TaxID=2268757 RepID=UPI000DF00FA5|nr:heavy-metal-associated domain-containing protein [Paracnuella aquatica]RPD46658.1 copper chaperone [Paracnuella aquatica]
MKKLLFLLFAVFAFAASHAQTKPMVTKKISTPSVQCGMCKNKIETYLKRYDGISMVTVNVKKKETTVKYITDRINEEEVKTAIANAGYDADDVSANPESYKKLPACCKKPEDGGGM